MRNSSTLVRGSRQTKSLSLTQNNSFLSSGPYYYTRVGLSLSIQRTQRQTDRLNVGRWKILRGKERQETQQSVHVPRFLREFSCGKLDDSSHRLDPFLLLRNSESLGSVILTQPLATVCKPAGPSPFTWKRRAHMNTERNYQNDARTWGFIACDCIVTVCAAHIFTFHIRNGFCSRETSGSWIILRVL